MPARRSRPARSAGDSRPGAFDARSLPRARSAAVAILGHGADHRRVGQRQGGRGARALHRHSTRGDKPFIALNMAAIPRDLPRVGTVRSRAGRLHRGAGDAARPFRAGARAARCSWTRAATMPAELQTRLLRVLSDGCFYAGGWPPAAARRRAESSRRPHQNLEERVRQGLVREDLYHRLNDDPVAAAAAARAARGHSAGCGAPFPGAQVRASWASRPSGCRPKRPERISQLPFPATCVSSRTCVTG